MPRISADLLDAYSSDVDLIRKKFDQRLRISMLNLFEHSSKTADTILVLPSGERIPIHSAIIRQRAPDFFFYLEHNFNACREGISEFILVEEPSNLISFLKLVYSDDEVPVFADFTNFESLNQMPTEGNNRPNDDSSAKKTLSQNSSDILKQSEPYCQTAPSAVLLDDSHEGLSTNAAMTSFFKLATQASRNQDLVCDVVNQQKCSSIESSMDENEIDKIKNLAADDKKSSMFSMFITMNGKVSRSYPSYPGQLLNPNYQNLNDVDRFSSLRASRTSINTISSNDFAPFQLELENKPMSNLASDLFSIYHSGTDSNVTLKVRDGELNAYWPILWMSTEFFKNIYEAPESPPLVIDDLKEFSKACVDFMLQFIHGRITNISQSGEPFLDIWELYNLATLVQLDELIELIELHIKAFHFHFHHNPCSKCISKTFSTLPKMKTLSGLQNLYHETVNWSIRYFYRFFISHAFQQLEESCQQKYFEDVKKSVSIDSIFDIIMGCDELSSSLLKIRNNELHETVQRVMTELAKSCEDYLLNSFDLVVSNMGTATNLFDPAKLILVNDVLPTFVHRLSPNVVIKTFISLNKLFLNPSVEAHKLFALFRRLHTLIDQHILHQASLMTSANNWALLSVEEQKRIINSGIFVDFSQAKTTHPRFSSSKRSAASDEHKISTDLTCLETSTTDEQDQTTIDNQISRTTKGQPITADNTENPPSTIKDEKKKSVGKKRQIPTIIQKGRISRHRTTQNTKSVVGTEDNSLERQNTHTIMSVEANKKAGIIHQSTLPHPTSIATAKSKAEEKPKSIVNPVQRVSPLMATTTSTAANPSNQQHNRPQNVEARGRQNRPAAAAVLRQDRAPRTTQKITTEKRKC